MPLKSCLEISNVLGFSQQAASAPKATWLCNSKAHQMDCGLPWSTKVHRGPALQGGGIQQHGLRRPLLK